MDDRIDKLRKGIEIQAIQSGLVGANGLPGFKVNYTYSDPHTAQQVCSDVTSMFTATNLRLRSQAVLGTTDYLKTELDQAKQTLDEMDSKLAAFESQHMGMLPSDVGGNVNVLNSLNSQLEAATQQIENLQQNESMDEALLAQQSAPSTATAPGSQTPQALEQELKTLQAEEADLTAHYTPDYPDVKAMHRKVQDLQKKIALAESAPPPAPTAPTANRPDSASVQTLRAQLSGIRLAIQEKKKLQDQLQETIRSYQGRIQSSPQVEQQEKQLTRDYQTAQAMYDKLSQQASQAKLTTDLESRQEGENFSVLDAANFPDAPTFPNHSVFAAGGVAAGLAFGLGIIALLDYRDTALRTERDVWAFTKLPTLAVIAWSGGLAEDQPRKRGFLKRLFSRKSSKKLAMDAPG